MLKIFLFAGGDGGGFILGPRGVKPIPPFTPKFLLQLRGLSALLNGSVLMTGESAMKMNKLLTETSNLVMAELKGIVGPLDSGLSLIYQDNDGGFTCGSTGPIRFPWPPRKRPNIEDLISRGLLQREFIDIIREVNKEGIAIRDILEEPVQRDALRVRKALDDKKGLFELKSRPYLVGRKLDMKIISDAIDQILTGGKNVLTRERDLMITDTVAVALALCTEITQVEGLDKAINIKKLDRNIPKKIRF